MNLSNHELVLERVCVYVTCHLVDSAFRCFQGQLTLSTEYSWGWWAKPAEKRRAISGAAKVGGGQGLSACGVKCKPCLWQWLPACVSISQRSIMQCPHAETFNSMLINAGEQSLLSAPAQATSVAAFVVGSGCFSLLCLFLCLTQEDGGFSPADRGCALRKFSLTNAFRGEQDGRWKTTIKVTFIVSSLNRRCDI